VGLVIGFLARLKARARTNLWPDRRNDKCRVYLWAFVAILNNNNINFQASRKLEALDYAMHVVFIQNAKPTRVIARMPNAQNYDIRELTL
jgi:hypothetical protein